MTASRSDTDLERVVVFANSKGGVLKTSLTANIAGLVGESGRRVLAIQLDSQGDLISDFGIDPAQADNGAGLYDAIARGRQLEPSLRNVRPGVDLITAGADTDALDAWVASRRGLDHDVDYALAQALAPLAGDYDLVLIDCPPGNRNLRMLAMVAARWVVIPTNADHNSRAGMRRMAELFIEARRPNPQLQLLGVVLTLVPTTATRVKTETRQLIADTFGGLVDGLPPLLDTGIRHAFSASVDLRARGLLAHELEKLVPTKTDYLVALRTKSGERLVPGTAIGLAEDYANLANEMLRRIAAAETNTSASRQEAHA